MPKRLIAAGIVTSILVALLVWSQQRHERSKISTLLAEADYGSQYLSRNALASGFFRENRTLARSGSSAVGFSENCQNFRVH